MRNEGNDTEEASQKDDGGTAKKHEEDLSLERPSGKETPEQGSSGISKCGYGRCSSESRSQTEKETPVIDAWEWQGVQTTTPSGREPARAITVAQRRQKNAGAGTQ